MQVSRFSKFSSSIQTTLKHTLALTLTPSTEIMSNQKNQVWGFARFLSLPGEIQLLIWKAVAESGDGAVLIESDPLTPGGLRLRTIRGQVPSVLHVNTDSRAAGLRVYRLAFGMVSGPPRPVYVNPGRDTLDISCNVTVFQTWVARNPAIGADLALVQNLRLFNYENVARRRPFDLLRHFPALRHLQQGEWTPLVLQGASADLVRQIRLIIWPGQVARAWGEFFGAQAGPPPILVILPDAQVQDLLQRIWA